MSDDKVELDCEFELEGDVCDIFFCHHGKFLLVGTDKDKYTVYNFPDRQKIKEIEGVSLNMQLVTNFKGSFSPTNESVVVMGKDKKVYIY